MGNDRWEYENDDLDEYESEPLVVETIQQAEQLALQSEFMTPPMITEADYIQAARIALLSRLRVNATAGQLGFPGFEGTRVLDVGARDGRFSSIPQILGASEVFGIDPNKEELSKAVQSGLLQANRAITCRLEEISQELRGTFDVAMVLNCCIGIAEMTEFSESLYNVLTPEGSLILTFLEQSSKQYMVPVLRRFFDIRERKLWPDFDGKPNLFLIVGSKRQDLNLTHPTQ